MPRTGRSRTARRPPVPAPGIRRILCPIDFSEFSRSAVDQAVALAGCSGAEITALFVFPIPPAADAAGATAETDTGVRAAVAEDLAEFVRPAREAGIKVWFALETGPVADAILSEAARLSADVIVMGTHGRSNVDRWMLGSVTDEVLRRAACPVLTVSPAMPATVAGRVRAGRILCALDLTEGSTPTAGFAFRLAAATGGPVTLLHVLDGEPAESEPARAGATHRLQEIAQAGGASSPAVEELVLRGQPRREILRAAGESMAAMIVIGLRAPEGVRPCLGSTAQHVVRHATVPVLTVRGGGAPTSRPRPSGT